MFDIFDSASRWVKCSGCLVPRVFHARKEPCVHSSSAQSRSRPTASPSHATAPRGPPCLGASLGACSARTLGSSAGPPPPLPLPAGKVAQRAGRVSGVHCRRIERKPGDVAEALLGRLVGTLSLPKPQPRRIGLRSIHL